LGVGYTIWSPEYVNYHGGVRALHVLKDELIKRGYPTTMHYEYHTEGNFVVYPEIMAGNPLNAKHYCHWLLNSRNLPDLTFGWDKNMGSDNVLTVNIIEPDIFYPRLNKREGVAYWVGKGSPNGFTIPDGAREITKTSPSTRTELAELMSSVEYVLSFDDYTSITIEATLLGTPVLIQTRNIEASKQRLDQSGFPTHGIFYDINDLPKAKTEVLKQHKDYLDFVKVFDERIDNFINITQLSASSIS
jgi:hypothetical protein